MIKIINNILLSNGYKLVEIELPFDNQNISLFCPNQENQKEEYFVTIQLSFENENDIQTFIMEKSQHIFEIISSSGKVDAPFEKNCTMLICHEENTITRQGILTIEEDQYNFKKNVITYSPIELETLKEYLTENYISQITNTEINKIISGENGKSFLTFKDNHYNTKGYYNLILKIILKLPFITYNPIEKELTNLCIDIENSFDQRQSLIYKQLLTSEIDWNEDSIYEQVEGIWGKL
ncbi:ABC-three component system middle component 1 [Acinetobacter nosocomialis]|uniref:ABC-three component system middle component 1 n=1 Tax=Acinetobacter nosocomialis TaxID=106654 RepID=UPI001B81F789|nr:ABC-three component system middle component 1 [Acinetobacter nosocomialis]MBR7737209.1 hypothetical protein [Acinetobacter nosocomialis]